MHSKSGLCYSGHVFLFTKERCLGLWISLARSMQNAGDGCIKRWALTGVWQMPSFLCTKCYSLGEDFYCWRTRHIRRNESSILYSSLPLLFSFFCNTGDLNLGSCVPTLPWSYIYTCIYIYAWVYVCIDVLVHMCVLLLSSHCFCQSFHKLKMFKKLLLCWTYIYIPFLLSLPEK